MPRHAPHRPREDARRRALRAARAVSLSVALAGASLASACSDRHGPGTADASVRSDASTGADAGCTACPPETEECRDAEGGFWDPDYGCSVAVPGPFVPPDLPA